MARQPAPALFFACVLGAACAPSTSEVEVEVGSSAPVGDAATAALLPPPAREAARGSTTRVLVPPRAELLAVATVIAKPEWHSVHMRSGGVTVVISASRKAHRHPGLPEAPRLSPSGPKVGRSVRGQRAFVSSNEGIPRVAWREGGVSYAVEIECHDRADARCTGDAEVIALAESLVWIGGGS